MENAQLWYYFFFIAAALISVVCTHLYLKAKLGSRHDQSLVWLAIALGIWLVVILIEWKMLSGAEDLKNVKEQEQEIEFLGILRRFLSVFNSVALILFLSYFQEGWALLNKKIKNLTATPELLGLIILTVCIGSALVGKTFWLGTEAAMSIMVSSLLTIGFTLSFWRREHMRWMCILALAGGALLVLNQLALLAREDTEHFHWLATFWPPGDDLIFRRMLALFVLLSNTGALALTWLGEQTEVVSASDGNKKNNQPEFQVNVHKIEFRYKSSSVTLYLTLSKPNSSDIFRLEFNEKELTPPKREFLFLHALATKTQKFVLSKRFNNFSKERDEVIEMLNRKLAPHDLNLTADVLFVRGRKIGEYRLRMEPDKIEIDKAVEGFLKESK